jgi:S1 RNA binding domain protein
MEEKLFMSIEVGSVLEGKVSGITNFGVFVDLPDGKTGLVHISEVAHTYVEQIKDFVKPGEDVKVKVTAVNDGKIALSMKQAAPKEERKAPPRRQREPYTPAPEVKSPGEYEWTAAKHTSDNSSFEDMMSKFKKNSEDKMSDLKRTGESKGYSRRGKK